MKSNLKTRVLLEFAHQVLESSNFNSDETMLKKKATFHFKQGGGWQLVLNKSFHYLYERTGTWKIEFLKRFCYRISIRGFNLGATTGL